MPNDLLKTITIDSIALDVAQTNSNPADASTQVATDEFVQSALLRRLPRDKVAASATNRSIPNNTQTATGATVTMPATGFYIAKGYANFNANASGRRAILLKNGSDVVAQVYVGAAQSGATMIECIALGRATQGSVFTVDVTQNSGGALTLATAWLDLYCIPD